MKILVVEDDEDIRRILDRLFAQQGWRMTAPENCQDALDIFDAASFDIALIDVNLWSGADGVSLALTLRKREPLFPIIMMSGNPGNAARVDAAGLGSLLNKPFDLSAIIPLLANLLT